MPCGEVAHEDCFLETQKFGCCRGACWERIAYTPLQFGWLQWSLKDLIFIAKENKEHLDTADIKDLTDEEMWWVLSCVYRTGVVFPENEKLAEKYFNKALEDNDPEAVYYQAMRKRDICLMQKAAALGQFKAIRSMANYCMGAEVLDKTRKIDMKEAARYVKMGKDPMCAATRAISRFKEVGAIAERDLLMARHYKTTPKIYSKVSVMLASIFRKRGEHERVLDLLMPMEKDEEVMYAIGASYSELTLYTEAVYWLTCSGTADSYVKVAKLMADEKFLIDDVRAEEADVADMMKLAGDHPEAAFYFLSKGGLEPKEISAYVGALKKCRDKDLLLSFTLKFGKKHPPYFKLCKSLFDAL